MFVNDAFILRTIYAFKIIFKLLFYYYVKFVTLYVKIMFRDILIFIIFKALYNFIINVK